MTVFGEVLGGLVGATCPAGTMAFMPRIIDMAFSNSAGGRGNSSGGFAGRTAGFALSA